ncbi:MAG: recombination protein RecR [Deltaproteobacteria bacterium]|nr:recombination protein RecR [Deltaproteobacteria bacterium]MBW2445977.1 recombination protein RecR [Deltaproteobacteria bacterium]
MRSSPPIDRVIAALKRLPGVGEKSATRLAFHLLSAPEAQAQELADAIVRLKKEIVLCSECFDLTDTSPCTLCRNESRDASMICVVEEPADLAAIELTASFRGRYHVLGGALAPIDGVGPEELRIADLETRVRRGGIQEVILATNPNAEGEATAHYIADRLRDTGVRVTRIAYGMPMGGDLEYADRVTVERSIQNRSELG